MDPIAQVATEIVIFLEIVYVVISYVKYFGEGTVASMFIQTKRSRIQVRSLSISSVMIIRIQSVHALCVASFIAHLGRRIITGPLENCLVMCSKPHSERALHLMCLDQVMFLYARIF